jgi:hypothetical protein
MATHTFTPATFTPPMQSNTIKTSTALTAMLIVFVAVAASFTHQPPHLPAPGYHPSAGQWDASTPQLNTKGMTRHLLDFFK